MYSIARPFIATIVSRLTNPPSVTTSLGVLPRFFPLARSQALIVQSHCPLVPLPPPPPPRFAHRCRSARCSSAQIHRRAASSPGPQDHSCSPVFALCPCLLRPAP